MWVGLGYGCWSSRYEAPVEVKDSAGEEDWVATRWILGAVLQGMFSPSAIHASGATTSRHQRHGS